MQTVGKEGSGIDLKGTMFALPSGTSSLDEIHIFFDCQSMMPWGSCSFHGSQEMVTSPSLVSPFGVVLKYAFVC